MADGPQADRLAPNRQAGAPVEVVNIVCPEECDHPSPAPPAAVRRDTIRMQRNEGRISEPKRAGISFLKGPETGDSGP